MGFNHNLVSSNIFDIRKKLLLALVNYKMYLICIESCIAFKNRMLLVFFWSIRVAVKLLGASTSTPFIF